MKDKEWIFQVLQLYIQQQRWKLSVISKLSCWPVSHTCSLEYDKESAISGSKSLFSSTNTSAKTSLSEQDHRLLTMLQNCKIDKIQQNVLWLCMWEQLKEEAWLPSQALMDKTVQWRPTQTRCLAEWVNTNIVITVLLNISKSCDKCFLLSP